MFAVKELILFARRQRREFRRPLVVDAVSLRPVGLLFAGGIQTTFANPIVPVLNRFAVAIV